MANRNSTLGRGRSVMNDYLNSRNAGSPYAQTMVNYAPGIQGGHFDQMIPSALAWADRQYAPLHGKSQRDGGIFNLQEGSPPDMLQNWLHDQLVPYYMQRQQGVRPIDAMFGPTPNMDFGPTGPATQPSFVEQGPQLPAGYQSRPQGPQLAPFNTGFPSLLGFGASPIDSMSPPPVNRAAMAQSRSAVNQAPGNAQMPGQSPAFPGSTTQAAARPQFGNYASVMQPASGSLQRSLDGGPAAMFTPDGGMQSGQFGPRPMSEFQQRAQQDIDMALAGRTPLPPPNAENSMLAPSMPHVMNAQPRSVVPGSVEEQRSGALQQRVPSGTQMAGGSTIVYRPDGRPVLLPPDMTADEYFNSTGRAADRIVPTGNGDFAVDDRTRRARIAGDRRGAYLGIPPAALDARLRIFAAEQGLDPSSMTRGEILGNLRARSESRQRMARDRTPAGYPSAIGRMNDEDRRNAMNQRRRARGLSALPENDADATAARPGDPSRVFQRNYAPPLTEDGQVDVEGLAADALDGLLNLDGTLRFQGDLDQLQSQLAEQGVSWNDVREQALDMIPGVGDSLFTLGTDKAKAEFNRRRKRYNALRQIDPTLPEWPESSWRNVWAWSHLEDGIEEPQSTPSYGPPPTPRVPTSPLSPPAF